MPTTPRKGFPEFFGGGRTDDVRSQFISKPLAAAQEAAFTTAVGTLEFLASLPGAMATAREREVRRMTASGRGDDPRLRAAESLVEQAKHVQKAATLGRARIQRVLTALNGDSASFHGFVSGQDLAPLPGMTVRIGTRSEDGKALTAMTDDDGYFSIPLGSRRKEGTSGAGEGNTGERGNIGGAAAEDGTVVTVEILDRSGSVVHRDPDELSLKPGRGAYREYFLEDEERPR